jgi:hypothetical protein
MQHTVRLTDDSDGIEIAKSGAPQPGGEMLAWLARQIRGAWSWDCDSVFNVHFRFADADDARRFRARWAPDVGGTH